jgi:hypothetical protein
MTFTTSSVFVNPGNSPNRSISNSSGEANGFKVCSSGEDLRAVPTIKSLSTKQETSKALLGAFLGFSAFFDLADFSRVNQIPYILFIPEWQEKR